MTPINRIINSGSTWTHTYQIEGLTENPIPPELRRNTTLTYEACLEIARSIIYMTFNEDSVKNYTKDQAIKFETDQCSESLKMSKVFNNQKSLLIGSIDHNIQNIQDFLKGKVGIIYIYIKVLYKSIKVLYILTYEACLEIARSIIYMTFNEGSVKNYTEDQAIKFETD